MPFVIMKGGWGSPTYYKRYPASYQDNAWVGDIHKATVYGRRCDVVQSIKNNGLADVKIVRILYTVDEEYDS